MGKNSLLNLSKLKSKEVKLLLSKIETWYDTNCSSLKSYSYYITQKGKIYLSSIDINDFNLKKITGLGMYFGNFADETRFRLSIEGSKLIKQNKNFIELDKKSLNSYICGENLFLSEVKINCDNSSPFLIVKYENENIGVTSFNGELLHTFIPKGRRLNFNKLF